MSVTLILTWHGYATVILICIYTTCHTIGYTICYTTKFIRYSLYRYIENQQILEGSEATKAALRSVIRILKTELKRRGIPIPSAASGMGAEMTFGDILVEER